MLWAMVNGRGANNAVRWVAYVVLRVDQRDSESSPHIERPHASEQR